MFKVIFSYDEVSCKWEATVEGAKDAKEAGQAFNAVALTCQQLDARLLKHNKIEEEVVGINGVFVLVFKIIPAV